MDPYKFTDEATGKSWRKVLFDHNRDFPDNYTPDACFLAAIKRNQNLYQYTYRQCLLGSSQVALQLCVVLVFAAMYIILDSGNGHSNFLLSMAAVSSFIGYCWVNISDFSLTSHMKDLQHVSIFLFFSFSFSPVLYKLTDTISTDTIHTTSGLMLFIHLVFHNYGLERATIVSTALSLNAALFASVCLASRLASSYDAFVLLSLSVEIFVLFPIFRLKLNGNLLLIIAIIGMICSVLCILATYSSAASFLATLSFFIVMGIAPWLFVRWQNFKHTIHGPWDEAVPNFK